MAPPLDQLMLVIQDPMASPEERAAAVQYLLAMVPGMLPQASMAEVVPVERVPGTEVRPTLESFSQKYDAVRTAVGSGSDNLRAPAAPRPQEPKVSTPSLNNTSGTAKESAAKAGPSDSKEESRKRATKARPMVQGSTVGARLNSNITGSVTNSTTPYSAPATGS